jgi:hypothetical protein
MDRTPDAEVAKNKECVSDGVSRAVKLMLVLSKLAFMAGNNALQLTDKGTDGCAGEGGKLSSAAAASTLGLLWFCPAPEVVLLLLLL